MNLVMQPKRSRLCGQACVATIAGITLADAILAFGTIGGTSWKKVAGVLRRHGFSCPRRLTRVNRQPLPERCIVKIWWAENSHRTHWSIKDGNRLLDPYHGEFEWGHIPVRNQANAKSKTARITSYAEIK